MDSFENDLIASTALSRFLRDLKVDMGSSESLRALGSAGKIEWDFLRSRVMDVVTDWAHSLPELGLTLEEIRARRSQAKDHATSAAMSKDGHAVY